VLKFELIERYLRESYLNTSGTSKQASTEAQLTWRASRYLSFFLDYALSSRRSDVPDTNFTEHRIWLSVGYGREAQLAPGPATPSLPGRTGNTVNSPTY
jgi:hypothetical protein